MKTQDKIIRASKKQPVEVKFLNGHSIKRVSQELNFSINGTMQYLTLIFESKIVDNIKGLTEKKEAVVLYDTKSRTCGTVYKNLAELNIVIDSCEFDMHLLELAKQSLHTTEEIEIAKEEFIQAMQHFHENFS
tara:strand:+ start:11405 stop:11803 length:399 start_codon:yes stop_codon:yes gene_type:complete